MSLPPTLLSTLWFLVVFLTTSRQHSVKTELLVQINGVASSEHDGVRVMLLAATNLPWELDEAMRRRLTKRVYIPLPEAAARRALFALNLRRVELAPDVAVADLVRETQVRNAVFFYSSPPPPHSDK